MYVSMSEVVMQRHFKPWLQPEWMFKLTSLKKTESESLAVLHGVTKSVIADRKRELSQKSKSLDFEGQDIGRCLLSRYCYNLFNVVLLNKRKKAKMSPSLIKHII